MCLQRHITGATPFVNQTLEVGNLWYYIFYVNSVLSLVTYERSSFLVSLGWNLTLKLGVVTSPGYFLSSRQSCIMSQSSGSDETKDWPVCSIWKNVETTKMSCFYYLNHTDVLLRGPCWLFQTTFKVVPLLSTVCVFVHKKKKLYKPMCTNSHDPFLFFCRQVMFPNAECPHKKLTFKALYISFEKVQRSKICICQRQDGAMHLTHHLCYTVLCFNCTVTPAFHWNKWIIERGKGDRK